MATFFDEHFEKDEDKVALDAHVLFLVRCMLNILRHSERNAALVSAVVEDLAGLDLPASGAPGGEDLSSAINLACAIKDQHGIQRSRGRPRRREALRPDASQITDLAASLLKFSTSIDELPGVFGVVEDNLALLRELFCLDEGECALLQLSVCCALSVNFDAFLDKCLSRTKHLETVVAGCLGVTDERARELVSPCGRLVRSGAVRFDRGHRWFAHAVCHNALFRAALITFNESPDQLRAAIVGMPVAVEFSLEDFPHVRQQGEMLARLLATAKAERVEGINLLICGPVGTGKTTVAAALAAAEGLSLYAVGESDDDGKEPDRDHRLQALQITQQVLCGHTEAIAMVDEAEDLLVPFRRGKIFVNRLLERNAVPTIYIINDVRDLSDAVKRRMTYVLELRPPPIKVRELIVRRVLEDRKLNANADDVCRIAALGSHSPAIISQAAQAAALSGSGIEVLIDGIKAMTRVLDEAPDEPMHGPANFDPRFCCADHDLSALAKRLVASPRRDVTMLLMGPPGCGKSAFARYMAKQWSLPVLQLRASDVLRPHVGETEMALTEAFARAKADGAILLLDEVDSLLMNRNMAVRSWEVSAVNTLLQLLDDDHPLPIICTTNAVTADERFDQAALRRFVFKINCFHLTHLAARQLFEHLFGHPAPRGLDLLSRLAPGDFAVVRKKASILGVMDDPAELYTMLSAECAAKGEQFHNMGFRLPETSIDCKLAA